MAVKNARKGILMAIFLRLSACDPVPAQTSDLIATVETSSPIKPHVWSMSASYIIDRFVKDKIGLGLGIGFDGPYSGPEPSDASLRARIVPVSALVTVSLVSPHSVFRGTALSAGLGFATADRSFDNLPLVTSSEVRLAYVIVSASNYSVSVSAKMRRSAIFFRSNQRGYFYGSEKVIHYTPMWGLVMLF